MSERCRCGRPLITRPGDLEATCAECRSKPDSCGCPPVSDTAGPVSDSAGQLTSDSDTYDTSDSTMEADDARLLAAVRDGTWLSGQHFPPLAYAVDGLIPEGFTLLVGPPKAGKSWLTLALLLAVASGGVALGAIKAAPSRRVLYLALEDGDRRMQDRCRQLLAPGEDIPPLFHYLTRVHPGMMLQTLDAWMRRHPDTAMIVVDTLGKVMPPALTGESAYQRDYRVGTALKHRADSTPGLAVLVLHHDRKAIADDFVDSVSGTHGLAGAADTVIVLARKRQSAEGLLKVTGRDVPEDVYALTIADGKMWQLDGASLRTAAKRARDREDEQPLGDKMKQVLAAVRAHSEGIRAADLVERFGKDVYQYLKRLEGDDLIRKVARGFYVPVSEPSEVSERQVSRPVETDTATLLSETVSEAGDQWPEGSYGEAAQ